MRVSDLVVGDGSEWSNMGLAEQRAGWSMMKCRRLAALRGDGRGSGE